MTRFHRHLIWLLLATAGASVAASDEPSRQADRMLDNAQRQVLFAKGNNPLALKEITPGCVAMPLSTTPSGPQTNFDIATGTAASVRVDVWRQFCNSNDGQLLLTFTPLTGSPFICGSDMKIRVGGVETDDLFLDVNPNDGVGTSFCGNLSATSTFVIHEFDNQLVFDDDQAFTLEYESDFGPDALVQIPAYDANVYAPGGIQALSGKLSGSYFLPSRNGEGVLVEVGRVGARKVVFVTWYTYFLGQQRWIFGSADFTAGATAVEVPMFISTGAQFGAAFQPSQVMIAAWGSANVSFPTCSSMRFAWSENGGQSAIYNYERALQGLDGISCP